MESVQSAITKVNNYTSTPSFLDKASSFATFAGALTKFQEGQITGNQYQFQAGQYDFAASQARLQGEEQSNNLRRELLKNLASSNARFAAGGISLSSGTPMQAQIISRGNAQRDIQQVQNNAASVSTAYRGNAAVSRASGRIARSKGLFDTGVTLLKGML